MVRNPFSVAVILDEIATYGDWAVDGFFYDNHVHFIPHGSYVEHSSLGWLRKYPRTKKEE